MPGTCPKCHSTESKAVGFSWWGGALGPKMFHHVKCAVCGSGYNVQTGKSNNRAIALYVLVTNVIGFGLLALFWANR